MKRPVSERQDSEASQLSHTERLLLSKLQETNQRLCKVTHLWNKTKRQATYLDNQYGRALAEIDQKDKYFETVSKGNIEGFQRREQELK